LLTNKFRSLSKSVRLANPFPPIFRSLTLFPNLFPRRFCSLLPFVPFQYLFTHILCSLEASAHSLLFTHISCSLRTIVH
jgi:hypothetical protein